MAKYNKAQTKFSLAEFNRLREEGKNISEITQILGISKATLYRRLGAATQSTTARALQQVEFYWDESFNALSEMLKTSNIPAEDLKTFRLELQKLHLTSVSNVSDALKLAKQIEAYLKYSE